MKTVEYFKAADESCKIYKHKSGIPIYVIEKPDFNTSFAVYGTKYKAFHKYGHTVICR